MGSCEKCGMEKDDVYKINGVEMCEECSMKYNNPSRPCGGGPGGQNK